MGVKSLCFGIVVFSIYFTSVVSEDHLLNKVACGINELEGLPCRTCDFLTFGQDEDSSGVVSYYCPNPGLDPKSEGKNEWCCYNPLRRPFCCNLATYAFTGFLWISAVLLVFGAIVKFIKCLIS